MGTDDISTGQKSLENWLMKVYGVGRLYDEPLTRQEFLHASWNAFADLVHWNKQNPLIKESVKQYPDLVPRCFAILSVLYGTYTYEPRKSALLRDFIALLGSDLTEEQLEVIEYTQQGTPGSFFPELGKLLAQIHEVYSAEHFNLSVLPPTPYQAYAFFVLNHPDLIGKVMSPEELFGYLSAGDSQMQKLFTLMGDKDPTSTTPGSPPKKSQ
jgi:hypothetical protein